MNYLTHLWQIKTFTCITMKQKAVRSMLSGVSECVHSVVLKFNVTGIISTCSNARTLRKRAAQVEISSSVATEMLDYTLKRRSARNNCLWKARRGSEVPLKWFGILSLCYFLSSQAETTVSDTVIRGPGERETPALQLTSAVHSRSVSKPAETKRESRYSQNAAISQTKPIHFHQCGMNTR